MAATVISVGSMLSLSHAVTAGRRAAVSNSTTRLQCGVVRPSAGARLPMGAAAPQVVKRRFSVVVKASETQVNSEAISDLVKNIKEQWSNLDDKVAITGLGFAGLILLWALTGLISALDRLPLIPDLFEIIGLLFTGWFIYRYLLFKPDREELLKVIDETKAKITGQ